MAEHMLIVIEKERLTKKAMRESLNDAILDVFNDFFLWLSHSLIASSVSVNFVLMRSPTVCY